MRPGLKAAAGLLLGLLFCAPPCPAAEGSPADWGPAWHVGLSGQALERRDLVEHYQFTPTMAVLGAAGPGWERKWRENRAGLTLGYDLVRAASWLLTPQAGLGVSQAWFSASHAGQGFSETWRTRPTLFWSLGGLAEWRANPAAGPLLRLSYSYRASRAGEESESTVSQRGGSGLDQRDACFRWQEQEVSLSAGWRLGAWTPRLGVAGSAWRLQKSLFYHIAEVPGQNPRDLALERLLNSQESSYQYHNGHEWAPLAALAWSPAPGWQVELSCQWAAWWQMGLAVELSF